jgi:ankyrin repeat protein
MQILSTPLESAIQHRNLDSVRQCIAHGETPQDLNHLGIPVLYDALKSNDLLLLEVLYEAGMDLTLPYNQHGFTPFIYACLYCELHTIEWLVAKGVDINLPTSMGITAVHVAAQRGDVNVVKFLYRKQANIFCHSNNKESPLLMSLTVSKSLSVLRFLLRCYKEKAQRIDEDLMPCIGFIFDKQNKHAVNAMAALLPYAAYIPSLQEIYDYLSTQGSRSSAVIGSLDRTMNSHLSGALIALLKSERIRRASSGMHSEQVFSGIDGL